MAPQALARLSWRVRVLLKRKPLSSSSLVPNWSKCSSETAPKSCEMLLKWQKRRRPQSSSSVRLCRRAVHQKRALSATDELDAIGTKRQDSEKSGDREVQRTMLELLNQLDGFASDDRIKVIAATNRVDVLDPALLRSGRLDRKIEFPLPNEEARAQILKIHSRKMKVDEAVNWDELARSTDEFGGAMLKAVCVEAGMIALRLGKNKIGHEHYVDAISEVQAKKKDVSSPPTS